MKLLRLFLIPLTLVACFAISGRAFAQDGEADYWELVAESIDLLEQESVSADELDGLIDRWNNLSNQSVRFEPKRIVDQLKAGDDKDAIDEHLQMFEALQLTRETWPEPNNGTISAAEANAQLEAILAEGRFQFADQDRFWLYQRIEEWGNAGLDWLNGWFDPPTRTDANGNQVNVDTDAGVGLIGLIAAVALGMILFQLIRQVTIGFNREAVAVKSDDDHFEPLTITEAMERAEKTAESGDYRHSVRYLYLSTLLILEEKGVLKPDRSLTNQEYLDVMDKHPKKAAVLRDVVNVFDRVWYGKREIDQPTLRFYQKQIEELQQEEADL